MTLHTQRLILQEVQAADAAEIHALNILPETDRYNTLGIPEHLSETELLVAEWMAMRTVHPQQHYVFAIRQQASNVFIGNIGLKLSAAKYRRGEVWYKVHVSHWGQGYATEALRAVLHFAFASLHLHRIEAGCAVENRASAAVLQKVGMIREGGKRKVLPIRGEWVDNDEYAILEEEYFDQQMNGDEDNND